jgi:hypothetical protein
MSSRVLNSAAVVANPNDVPVAAAPLGLTKVDSDALLAFMKVLRGARRPPLTQPTNFP